MPKFKWYGIDISGRLQYGKTIARSVKDLDNELLKKEIALLKSIPETPWLLLRPITLNHKIQFFKQLSILLQAGIFLDQAVELLINQTKHSLFKQILKEVLTDIKEGIYIHTALNKFPYVFDSLTIQMIQAGHESGQLSEALAQLSDYKLTIHEFYKKIRSAALLPLITFLFFLIIALIIFIVIVPSFVQMFVSAHQSIPYTTQVMVNISEFLRSSDALFSMAGVILIMFGIKISLYYYASKKFFDYLWLNLPIISRLTVLLNNTYFLQSLALLMQGGVHIVSALHTAQESIGNLVIKEKIKKIIQQVDQGHTVSKAMQESNLFSDEIIAVVSIGEEAGKLPFMLTKAADIYKEKVSKILSCISTVIQPILMIILGLLITFLIFAVYLPVFNLSYVIA